MKTLFIMRGIPGSGKSTRAKELAKEHDAVICSADDFFIGDDGIYRFNGALLGSAHAHCQARARTAMKDGRNVIIDNTNIRVNHFDPYMKMAFIFGYEIRIIEIPMPSAEIAASRNVHGVPVEAIRRMISSYEKY